MAHFIKRELATNGGYARRIHEECSVAVGALPDDLDPELVMVLMTEGANYERALRLTIAEALILQRNLGAALDDLRKRRDVRLPTVWERLADG